MEMRIVKEKLEECHKVEGVNHLEVCKGLAERYITMVRDNKIQGYRIVDQSD